MSVMPKLFKKKSWSNILDGAVGGGAGGGTASSGAGAGVGGNNSNSVPVVEAVPMQASRIPPPLGGPPPFPQSKPAAAHRTENSDGMIGNQSTGGNLKHPPEDLLGLNSNGISPPAASGSSQHSSVKAPPSTASAASGNDSDSSSGSEESESDDDSSSYEYDDDSSLDDEHLTLPVDTRLCRLESDHASSSVVNSLTRESRGGISEGGEREGDNRKPAASALYDVDRSHPADVASARCIEGSSDRMRKLRLEAQAMDMAYLESTAGMNNGRGDGMPRKDDEGEVGAERGLECPSGMSPEVFFELPPEMQREVMEQYRTSVSNGNTGQSATGKDLGQTSAADIDPETLASLPDHIRREVLEQARREQQQKHGPLATDDDVDLTPSRRPKGGSNPPSVGKDLTESTAAFLSGCDIDAEDYENFPEDIKNDIMEERRRSMEKIRELTADDGNGGRGGDSELDLSGYDPEMLASLPEDVREEVLEEERRQREERKRRETPKRSVSAVGAHSVSIPAGYDPDTFEALPEEMQRELLDDARRQRGRNRRHSAEEYDYGGIVDATVVRAYPMGSGSGGGGGGTATSCTYTGEYNAAGKRNGDGELEWANGDKYVGKFKDGYIDGRGTINFHDGTEYAGQWKKNRFHGEGTRRFNNGNVYTGNYVNGKRRGQGKCYFANGDMYVGDWKEDTIHGFGRYYYNNGHSFEGMFRNGKRNGRGKYQLTDGRVEIYRYANDSRVGDGVRWSTNRKKAWRMNDGKVTKKVSIEEAAAIAKRCGPVVEES